MFYDKNSTGQSVSPNTQLEYCNNVGCRVELYTYVLTTMLQVFDVLRFNSRFKHNTLTIINQVIEYTCLKRLTPTSPLV